MADIRRGTDLAGADLWRETVDGYEYWSDANRTDEAAAGTVAHLLPNFDEFTVAYRDRSALVDPNVSFDATQFAYYRDSAPQGGILSNVVTVNGRVRGAWSRTLSRAGVRIELRLLGPLAREETDAVGVAADRFGRFLEREVDVEALAREGEV
jgi:hypothetical protein